MARSVMELSYTHGMHASAHQSIDLFRGLPKTQQQFAIFPAMSKEHIVQSVLPRMQSAQLWTMEDMIGKCGLFSKALDLHLKLCDLYAQKTRFLWMYENYFIFASHF